MKHLLEEHKELFTKSALEKYKSDKVYKALIERIVELDALQTNHFALGYRLGNLLAIKKVCELIADDKCLIEFQAVENLLTQLEDIEAKLLELHKSQNSEKFYKYTEELGVSYDR